MKIEAAIQALVDGSLSEGAKLDFTENHYISTEQMGSFCKALVSGKAPQGLTLNFAGTGLSGSPVLELADTLKLKGCPSGLKINVSNNRMTDFCLRELFSALSHGHCSELICRNLYVDVSRLLRSMEGRSAEADQAVSIKIVMSESVSMFTFQPRPAASVAPTLRM